MGSQEMKYERLLDLGPFEGHSGPLPSRFILFRMNCGSSSLTTLCSWVLQICCLDIESSLLRYSRLHYR